MDPVTGVLAAEVFKALIIVAFEEARRRGLNAEQMERLYLEERIKFLANDPSKLPEV